LKIVYIFYMRIFTEKKIKSKSFTTDIIFYDLLLSQIDMSMSNACLMHFYFLGLRNFFFRNIRAPRTKKFENRCIRRTRIQIVKLRVKFVVCFVIISADAWKLWNLNSCWWKDCTTGLFLNNMLLIRLNHCQK